MIDARFSRIRVWAHERNLIEGSDVKSQLVKLGEEMGELCAAVARGRLADAQDAVGDMAVVLTILARQLDPGVTFETCVDRSWDQIKDRRGRMVDGVFIKEEDLP